MSVSPPKIMSNCEKMPEEKKVQHLIFGRLAKKFTPPNF